MRILFICSSLEPGKDGVGDYTIQLAAALNDKGHTTAIIALNDRHAHVHSVQLIHQTINTLRLPLMYAWKKRSELALEFIQPLRTDWLSLQYVSFGFNPKGLPFGLSQHIKRLQGNAKLHVMFHELWVGFNQKSSLKIKTWSLLQKAMFQSFLQRLGADVITTNTGIYQKLLQDAGFVSTVLPLFSNIPVYSGRKHIIMHATNTIQFIAFGMIHPGAPLEAFINAAVTYGKKYNKEPEIIFTGNNGNEKQHWKNVCNRYGCRYLDKGWQPEVEISATLSAGDFGITTTPYLVIEKSGSVAAMLAHGLSVICLAENNPKIESDHTEDASIFIFNSKSFEAFLQQQNYKVQVNTPETVACTLAALFLN